MTETSPPVPTGPDTHALVVRPRHGAPRRLSFGARMITIGRARAADIVLGDPVVSSVHARLEPGPAGGHRLIDCHSRNGTRVNDEAVVQRDLLPGDRIQVGTTTLYYVTADTSSDIVDAMPAPVQAKPTSGVSVLVDDTTTVTYAPADFDIDFLEPRTVSSDRTGEAALERRLMGLYKAAKTLTPIQQNGVAVESRFVKLAQELLGVMRVALLRITEPGTPAEVVASDVRAPAETFAGVPPEPVVLREAARTGRALLYRRPGTRSAEGRNTPLAAIICAVAVDGEPGLVAYADVFEPWPSIHQDELRLLGILARHLGSCIDNQRLQARLVDANRDLEARVERRSRELIESSKLAAIGTLAAGIAHEFNNVLAVIMGNAELAQQGAGLAAETREQVDTILDAARRSKEIIRHLLTFSRRREPKREPVNLVEVVEGTLRLTANELNRAGIRVRRTFVALPPVKGDAGQLALAILNLIKNAKDAMPKGGELRIALRRRLPTEEGGHAHAVLEIQDSGTGIAPEIRSRLFEPFFTTKPPGQGTGLGLSTAYGVVTGHEGKIEVDSTPGEGATFRLVLPLEASQVAELSIADLALEGTAPSADVNALHVLVVDDDPAVRSTLAAMIRRLKHHATLVASGPEALKALEGARFDLVLADIGMAGMDGITLRAEILRRNPAQPIILITGNADVDDIVARHEIPETTIVRKPFSFREIAETIGKATRK